MPEATVRDLMRTEVPIAAKTDSIATVARLLADSGLPGVPVLEDGDIVGIVTEKDLIAREANVDIPTPLPFLDAMFILDGGRHFNEELRHVLAVTAGDLMTSPVFNILETATLSQVATLMLDEGVNPIPVVNAERHLVGIVSRSDIVRVIAKLESAPSGVDAELNDASDLVDA